MKLRKNIIKVMAGILSLVIIIKVVPFADVFAQGRNITFDFTDGTIDGNVITYNVDGVNVTATLDGSYQINNEGKTVIDDEEFLTAFTISNNYDAETMQIRAYANDGFNLKYTYSNGTLTQIDNGGLPDNVKFAIEKKTNNPPPEEPGVAPGPEPGEHFDGRAVVLWSCGNNDDKVCYHEFDVDEQTGQPIGLAIGDFDDGNSTFFRDIEIEADNKPGTTFNVDAEYREWYLADEFYNWLNLYEIATGNPVDWDTLEPEIIMGDPNQHIGELEQEATATCGAKPQQDADRQEKKQHEDCINLYAAQHGEIWTHELQPVGEPTENNAYVSYGDRNFKVVIYNSDYRGITTGDLTGLDYYPTSWADPFLRTDQYDVSDTDESHPTGLNSILLENIVNIDTLPVNNFEIADIEALDVPEGAVEITRINGNKYKLEFSSNFYDHVVFKITDTNNEEFYIQVKRFTIDGYIRYDNDRKIPVLAADFYFDRTKSYEDFIITAKILYKDGTTKNVTLDPINGFQDGLGNPVEGWEFDQENPDFEYSGKGLKMSRFEYDLEQNEDRNIQDVYLNAEYKDKDNDAETYEGAYSGSGEGTLANIYHPEEGE